MRLSGSDDGFCHLLRKSLWLFLVISLAFSPVAAQRRPIQRRSTTETPPRQAVSFDTLLAADSYNIYGEVRGVGQLMRSEGVKDLLDPITKLTAPPKEFRSLVKWLNTRADALMTSRLLFAVWPARPKLPNVLVAIEFPSVEEAEKFEPQLKDFLPKLLPTSGPSPGPIPARPESSESKQNEKPAPPPYILKQAGSLVFISDQPFTFKDLKPAGSKLLAEDQNFRMVHDRFSSEPILVYVDLVRMNKEEKDRQRRIEDQQQQESEATSKQLNSQTDNNSPDPEPTPQEPGLQATPESPQATPEATAQTETTVSFEPATQPAPDEAKAKGPDPMGMAMGALSSAFFGGQPKWPEAVGAAIVFEGDSYVVRVLLVNKPDVKGGPIPFLPQFISGPALLPESPSILPGDTELFVSASLDFPQIYEGMVKIARDQFEQMQRYRVQSVKSGEPLSPFEPYEKKLGIKIKDDLLPLLGNEVAFTIPVKVLDAGPPEAQPSPAQATNDESKEKQAAPEGPSPVFAIAVKDRPALRALLPRIIDSLGVKGASMLAQTEKRDDTELVSYANAFAYAFVGNFLVMSPDVKATRHVVDSYLSHDTLSSSIHFRNYTRWQPRQVLGQVYVSPALMESYNSFAATAQISDQLRDFLMLLSPVAQPVTYAISNEGPGPLHELHVPKNLVMLMVAGVSNESNESPQARNEMSARNAVRAIASAEATYQATDGKGSYGSMDELIKTGLVPKGLVQNYGYKVELTVSGTRFEVVAFPIEYGKTGRLSFFVDESSVLRAGDHAGGPATVADRPGE